MSGVLGGEGNIILEGEELDRAMVILMDKGTLIKDFEGRELFTGKEWRRS